MKASDLFDKLVFLRDGVIVKPIPIKQGRIGLARLMDSDILLGHCFEINWKVVTPDWLMKNAMAYTENLDSPWVDRFAPRISGI